MTLWEQLYDLPPAPTGKVWVWEEGGPWKLEDEPKAGESPEEEE